MLVPANMAARWCQAFRASDYRTAIAERHDAGCAAHCRQEGVELTGVPNRARSPARAAQKLPVVADILGIFIVFQSFRALIRRGGGGPGSGLRSRGMGGAAGGSFAGRLGTRRRRLGRRWRFRWRRRRIWRLRRWYGEWGGGAGGSW